MVFVIRNDCDDVDTVAQSYEKKCFFYTLFLSRPLRALLL